MFLRVLSERKPGRPPKGKPATLQEAHQRIEELEKQYVEEATAREELYCRSEFLALRLKWSEIKVAELCGETVSEETGPQKKRQIKKKEKEQTLEKMRDLVESCKYLSKGQIAEHTPFSRSQLDRWQNGEQLERKERAEKLLPETTVENAAKTIATFPHFGGRKGQAYMDYHQKGHIGQKEYDKIKKSARRLFLQEVLRRGLFPERKFYEHVRPAAVGEIWAEDFTDLVVEGHSFKVAVLLDVYDSYYHGAAAGRQATAALVASPVEQALKQTGGTGPKEFLLSDNGSQYISENHRKLLTSKEIVHRLIPACFPEYNGTAEGGMREFKSVFYNVWERRQREGADEGKNLLERVRAAVQETVRLMNDGIPRPCLGGVTPADVHFGRKHEKQREVRDYREKEAARRDVPPWRRSYREVLTAGLEIKEMSDGELVTKTTFFCRKPLRRIARRNRECVG
jgi:transposase InsO family protein